MEMGLWGLPGSAWIGGLEYGIHGDFRDILRIFRYLNDPELSEQVRWAIALALFYEGEVPQEHQAEAVAFFVDFINCGQEARTPGPRLLDWEQDAAVIVADVNKVAGTEIRALPFLHWWTFMAYFGAIGEGQLSALVSVRDKLARGKKLEKWEQEFYRRNRDRVVLKKRYSAEEIAQKERLERLLE